MIATLSFGSPVWCVYGLVALAAVAVVLVHGLRAAAVPTRARVVCVALKFVAVLLLAVALAEPLWSGTRAAPGENIVLIMADDSRSLTVADRPALSASGAPHGTATNKATTTSAATNEAANESTPAARMKALLTADASLAGWQRSLSERFAVRRFRFDARPHAVESFEGLRAAGGSSELLASLSTLAERLRGRPVAGVLVFTDATSSDLHGVKTDLAGRGSASLPFVVPASGGLRASRDDRPAEAGTTNSGPPEGGMTNSGTTHGGVRLLPVFPVIVADERAGRPDVAVTNVSINHSPFEEAPVTIQADVSALALKDGTVIRARLVARPGTDASHADSKVAPSDERRVVAEQTSPVANGRVTFRFELRPDRPGPQFYEVEAEAIAASGAAAVERVSDPFGPMRDHRSSNTRGPNGSGDPSYGRRADESPRAIAEIVTANNRRMLCVHRAAAPHRVLYVAGRPNWEFKFLNRAVAEDDSLQLAALIRIARREAKFDFRGRAGESSNALFRGFRKEAGEETERYDEPVIVRVNVKDAAELRGGFPKTAEELFGFRAVVLDDVEAGFFTHDQLALLERFVSERGGGLLMLGGQESFADGGYARSPLAPALPVYLKERSRAADSAVHGGEATHVAAQDAATTATAFGPVRLDLTRDGWLLPWARLRRTEAEERTRLSATPAFRTVNHVADVRPGATVVATAGGESGAPPLPALVVHRYGRGAAAALALGDLWRWQMRKADGTDDLPKMWRQTLRWLVADVPELFDLKATPVAGDVDGRVRIALRARDRAFRPLDNADVRFAVKTPSGETTAVAAEASTEEAGLYRAEFVPSSPGGHIAQARVIDGDGHELATVETGWAHDPDADEFRIIVPQLDALRRLARSTGGEVLTPDDLAQFASRLDRRDVPVVETTTWPLWHNGWCLFLVVCCLSAEWGVRRRCGLA